MTRDDIIRMLTEVGLWQILEIRALLPYLERFAALVTAETGKEIAALREEVERLRDELRQSSIDHTRAEVERLREALVRFGRHQKECDAYRGCVCGLDAALQGETAIWSARNDPRE